MWPFIEPILVTFGENVIFAIPTKSLMHVLFHRVHFESLLYFLTPRNLKMCDPILVTLLKSNATPLLVVKMRPNPGHSTPPLEAHSQEMQTPKHLC